MKMRLGWAFCAVCLLGPAASAWAQATSVKFKVPVRLSDLSPKIERVQVRCSVSSTAPGGTASVPQELAVTGGQVAATATVVLSFAALEDPAGKTATYNCALTGFDKTKGAWRSFREDHPEAAFRLSPTPAPITGSFAWVEPTATAPANVTTTSPGGNP